MEKRALVALIHILQCASSSLRVVIKDVPRVTPVSMHILKFAAHPYYPISVTELSVISIIYRSNEGPEVPDVTDTTNPKLSAKEHYESSMAPLTSPESKPILSTNVFK